MAESQTVHEAILKLRADSAQLRQDLTRGQGILETGLAKMRGMVGAGLGLGTGSVALLAGIGGGILKLARDSADYSDAIGKAAQATGTAVEFISAMRHGADLAGVGFEELTTGLGRYNRVISDAAQGSDTAQRPFNTLKIALHDANGVLKTNEALLSDVADRFAAMPDGVTKSALAQDLFGGSGARLIPLLNGGSQGIANFTDEAKRMNLVVSAEGARAAEQFNDNLLRMEKSVTGLKIAIGNQLIPAAVELLDVLARLGGVKLEGFDERALQRQLRVLEELQRLARPGTSGFEQYAAMIADVQAKLQTLRDTQKEEGAKTDAPVLVDQAGLKKSEDTIRSFFDGLQKQLEQTKSKLKEGLFGEGAALGDTLDAALRRFKESAAANNIALPKDIDARFAALKQAIMGANDELRTQKLLFDQLGAADVIDAEFMAMRREQSEAENKINRELAERLRLLTLEQTFGGADIVDAEQGREIADQTEKVRDLGQTLSDLRDRQYDTQQLGIALGDSFDLTSEKIAIQRERVEALVEQYGALSPEVTAAVDELNKLENVKANKEAFHDFSDAITRGIRETVIGIQRGEQEIGEGIKNVFRNVFLSVEESILDKTLIAPLKGIMNAFFDGFAEAFADASDDAAQKMAKDLGRTLGDAIREILSDLGSSSIGGGGGGLGNIFGGIFSGIGGWISGLLGFEKGGLVPAFEMGGMVGSLPHFDNGGLAVLHPGEFVLQEPSARSIGRGNLETINRTGKLPDGGGGMELTVNFKGLDGATIIPRAPWMTREDTLAVTVSSIRDQSLIYNAIKDYGPRR